MRRRKLKMFSDGYYVYMGVLQSHLGAALFWIYILFTVYILYIQYSMYEGNGYVKYTQYMNRNTYYFQACIYLYRLSPTLILDTLHVYSSRFFFQIKFLKWKFRVHFVLIMHSYSSVYVYVYIYFTKGYVKESTIYAST